MIDYQGDTAKAIAGLFAERDELKAALAEEKRRTAAYREGWKREWLKDEPPPIREVDEARAVRLIDAEAQRLLEEDSGGEKKA